MKGLSIPVFLLFLLSCSGRLEGQTQHQGKGAVSPLKIGQAEAEAHRIAGEKPQFPKTALVQEIQGDVKLHAVVGKNGAIEKVKAISGNPLLVHSMMGTVQQTWEYKPFLVNGAPVEAEFYMEYVFKLD